MRRNGALSLRRTLKSHMQEDAVTQDTLECDATDLKRVQRKLGPAMGRVGGSSSLQAAESAAQQSKRL